VIANTYHKAQKRSRRSLLPVGDYGRLLADAGVGMFMRATVFAILLLVPMAAAVHSASGAEPVGIVFDLTGPAEPALQRFAELSDGGSYKLGPSTRLTFVHYRTCRVVSVVGGTVRLDQARYNIIGGRIESDQLQPCPQHYVVAPTGAPAGTTGALLLRSGGNDAPITSARPDLILTGARADAFSAVEVRRDDVAVALSPLGGRRFVWPRNRERLAAGEGYRLVLSRPGGARVEIPFTVVESPRSTEPDRLLIVRVD